MGEDGARAVGVEGVEGAGDDEAWRAQETMRRGGRRRR